MTLLRAGAALSDSRSSGVKTVWVLEHGPGNALLGQVAPLIGDEGIALIASSTPQQALVKQLLAYGVRARVVYLPTRFEKNQRHAQLKMAWKKLAELALADCAGADQALWLLLGESAAALPHLRQLGVERCLTRGIFNDADAHPRLRSRRERCRRVRLKARSSNAGFKASPPLVEKRGFDPVGEAPGKSISMTAWTLPSGDENHAPSQNMGLDKHCTVAGRLQRTVTRTSAPEPQLHQLDPSGKTRVGSVAGALHVPRRHQLAPWSGVEASSTEALSSCTEAEGAEESLEGRQLMAVDDSPGEPVPRQYAGEQALQSASSSTGEARTSAEGEWLGGEESEDIGARAREALGTTFSLRSRGQGDESNRYESVATLARRMKGERLSPREVFLALLEHAGIAFPVSLAQTTALLSGMVAAGWIPAPPRSIRRREDYREWQRAQLEVMGLVVEPLIDHDGSPSGVMAKIFGDGSGLTCLIQQRKLVLPIAPGELVRYLMVWEAEGENLPRPRIRLNWQDVAQQCTAHTLQAELKWMSRNGLRLDSYAMLEGAARKRGPCVQPFPDIQRQISDLVERNGGFPMPLESMLDIEGLSTWLSTENGPLIVTSGNGLKRFLVSHGFRVDSGNVLGVDVPYGTEQEATYG